MASTRWPPKSWAACSMCAFARRRDSSASRISGCFSAGVAAGVAGALAAGVAGRLALFGAAGAAAMNANARMRHARASKLTILVFMNYSFRPNYGSDRRIAPPSPSACPPLDLEVGVRLACCVMEASCRLPRYTVTRHLILFGYLHGDEQNIFVPSFR